jgi:hypothetical protein
MKFFRLRILNELKFWQYFRCLYHDGRFILLDISGRLLMRNFLNGLILILRL